MIVVADFCFRMIVWIIFMLIARIPMTPETMLVGTLITVAFVSYNSGKRRKYRNSRRYY